MSKYRNSPIFYPSIGLSVLTVSLLLWYGTKHVDTPQSTHRPTAPTTEAVHAVEDSSAAPVVDRNHTLANPTVPIGSLAREKHLVLSEAREHRPPDLLDRQIVEPSDPERAQRYAARASRAERLNQRLTQRIDALTEELARATPEERPRFEFELQQLRDHLAKRQALERAAFPMPQQRPALERMPRQTLTNSHESTN